LLTPACPTWIGTGEIRSITYSFAPDTICHVLWPKAIKNYIKDEMLKLSTGMEQLEFWAENFGLGPGQNAQ
jgi:hypothetical protein